MAPEDLVAMARLSPVRRPAVVATAVIVTVLLGLAQATALAGGVGTIVVDTEPVVAATVRIDGEPRNTQGVRGLELAAGDHQVCFEAVADHVAPPCQWVTIVAGRTTHVVGRYERAGTLRVSTEPSGAAQITVDGIARDRGELRLPVAAGRHEVCFGDLSGHHAPPCQTVDVRAGVTRTVVGTYRVRGAGDAGTSTEPPGSPPSAAPGTDPSFARACPGGGSMRTGFGDVPPGGPHAQAVACAGAWGIISGRSATVFDPARPVTRGQVATMLHRLITATGGELGGSPVRFADLAGSPHRAAVEALAGAGIVAGRGDGTFDGDAAVRRDQMASLLVRTLDRGYRLSPAPGRGFRDVPSGGPHTDSVRRLVGSGVTQGYSDGTFAPERSVSREQMATFVMRLADVLVVEARTGVPAAAR